MKEQPLEGPRTHGRGFLSYFHFNGLTVVPSQAKERNQIKCTSSPSFFSGDRSHHQLSAPVGWVERTEKRGSWQSRVGTTVGPTTWPVQATMPPHRRIHSHCSQLSPPGLRWTFSLGLRSSGPACIRTSWEVLTCAFVHTTIGFFELDNHRPGVLLDFLCLYKTCRAGYAAFLPPFFPDASKMPSYQEASEEQGFLTMIPQTYKDMRRP